MRPLVIGTREQAAKIESDWEIMRAHTAHLQLLDAERVRAIVPPGRGVATLPGSW